MLAFVIVKKIFEQKFVNKTVNLSLCVIFINSPPPPSADDLDAGDDAQVVATASGEFDSNGGVLSSVETGVSIVIPKGAIRPGIKQPIYFKVCRDNTALPPLDREKGENWFYCFLILEIIVFKLLISFFRRSRKFSQQIFICDLFLLKSLTHV